MRDLKKRINFQDIKKVSLLKESNSIIKSLVANEMNRKRYLGWSQ